MSKKWFGLLTLAIIAMLALAACGGGATATPRPSATPTEEATEAVAAPTEEATEVATEEATEEPTEVATEAPTEEATEEATETPTEEATEEPTEVATEAPTEEATEVATEEPTEAATVEPTEETTEAATAEATEEAAMAPAGAAVVTIAPGEPVRIGFAAALSGEGLEPLGVDEQRGAELQLADRPTVTVGGVEFTVELDPQDELCSAEGGATVANRFASDESIVAVVGHMCSSSCRAAVPVYADASLVMVSPSCTAVDLTADGGSPAFVRVVANDAFQGRVAADFIYNQLGVRKVATIHDGSPYGEGLVNNMADTFIELGGEVVARQAINVGETDFRAVLEEIASAEPELIYFGGFVAEGARLIEQRADVGLEDVPFMGADGIYTPEVINLAGEATEGVYASAPVPPAGDAYDEFIAKYVEAYGEEPIAPFHATAYDATGVILDAIEAVGTLDADGNLVIDRAALVDAIRNTSGYVGVTGVLSCDQNGDCGNPVFGLFVVRDGEFVPAVAE